MKKRADTIREPERPSTSFDLKRSDQVTVVALGELHMQLAMQFVSSCGACCPTAYLTFDYLLDRVTELDPSVTEYLLPELVPCPSCGNPIDAKTPITVG